MLLQLYLLLVARIPEEEEEEEELQRKDDDDEEVEEEDIALLVLLAMFVLLVSIVVAADANMTRYNLSGAYRYFLFFCLTCARARGTRTLSPVPIASSQRNEWINSWLIF